jgi:hypothetical protein
MKSKYKFFRFHILGLTIWSSFLIDRISFDENKKPSDKVSLNETKDEKECIDLSKKEGQDETSSRLNNLYLSEKEKAFVQK